MISAFAGVLSAGTLGSADPTSGVSCLVRAFAAAFLGATTIMPGRFNPLGSIAAVDFLVTGITGLQLLGVQTFVQQLFSGGALVRCGCASVRDAEDTPPSTHPASATTTLRIRKQALRHLVTYQEVARRLNALQEGASTVEVSAATGPGIALTMAVYVALGDSISIDDYTGVTGGGAPSQLARRLRAELVDLTRDGNTTDGVLTDLAGAPAAADVVTLTAGGNDLLGGSVPRGILRRLEQIVDRIEPLGARVIVNTVYDPTDGDDDVGRRELGLSRLAALELRRRLNALNRGIRRLTADRGFLLADLERLFHGHGIASSDAWFVQVIEPNLAGATAIAGHWHELLTAPEQELGRDGGVARSTDGVVAGEA